MTCTSVVVAYRPIKIPSCLGMALFIPIMNNNIHILTFNVNGLNNRDKQLRLKEIVRIHRPDILSVVDTRICCVRSLSAAIGAHSSFVSPPVGRSGGVAVFILSPHMTVSRSSNSPCGNVFKLDISSFGFSFVLVSLYAPSLISERTIFFRHVLSPFFVLSLAS